MVNSLVADVDATLASLILLGGSAEDPFGSRSPLVIGPSVTAAGYAILGLSGGDPSYWTGFLPGLVVVSLGMTFNVAPLTTTAFDAAPDDRSGTASGINNAAREAGLSPSRARIGRARTAW